jgi:hypothetical protein
MIPLIRLGQTNLIKAVACRETEIQNKVALTPFYKK